MLWKHVNVTPKAKLKWNLIEVNGLNKCNKKGPDGKYKFLRM